MKAKIYLVNVNKLAKLFYKYDFFNDELDGKDMHAYEILLGVYDALNIDAKNRLHTEYSVVKACATNSPRRKRG